MYTSVLKYLSTVPTVDRVAVLASYPDAFLGVPSAGVYDGSKMGHGGDVYEALSKFQPLNYDPYIDIKYRNGQEHFVQCVLRECFGLRIERRHMPNPVVTYLLSDMDNAKACLAAAGVKDKFVIVQSKGGTSYYSPELSSKTTFQARHLNPIFLGNAVDEIKKMGYDVIQFKLPGEDRIPGTTAFSKVIGHKTWCAIANLASKIICIDSSLMHIAAGLGKRALVFWGATNKVSLGWDIHRNVTRSDSSNWKCNGCGRPNTHYFDNPQWSCKSGFECGNYSRKEILLECEKYMSE
jgi:hypothetical protein